MPIRNSLRSRAMPLVAALVAVVTVTACSKQAPAPVRQPPEVAVLTVAPRTIPFSPEFVAQTAGRG